MRASEGGWCLANDRLGYMAYVGRFGGGLQGVEKRIAHLSDEIARDWKLSPDGSTLAYSVAESGAQPQVITRTLDARATAELQAAWNGRASWSREIPSSSRKWAPSASCSVSCTATSVAS